MAAYGDPGPASVYEYDHLVSLELGGAVNDPRNLWPEPGASPNLKDSVENALHRMVCDGQMQLAQAQRIIATGWAAWAKARGYGAGRPKSPPSETGTSTSATSTSSPSTALGPSKPISEVNCSDFPTHAAAQQWFAKHGGSPSNDVAGLDHDHDGLACESLP
jgi:Excalibur calcium-binding domain